MKRFLRWLGLGVYPSFVPGGTEEGVYRGAETFLEDLWRDARPIVALTHTVLAVFAVASPILVAGKMRFLHRLGESERDAVIGRMMHSRVYFLRLITYAVRGDALVAVLRHPAARAAILPRSPGSAAIQPPGPLAS